MQTYEEPNPTLRKRTSDDNQYSGSGYSKYCNSGTKSTLQYSQQFFSGREDSKPWLSLQYIYILTTDILVVTTNGHWYSAQVFLVPTISMPDEQDSNPWFPLQ